jgi:glycosyltransferase involved in cell wall biosynthesis
MTKAMSMLRLLMLTAEPFPTFRADVAALFGRWLPRSGVSSDLVTVRDGQHRGAVEWGGGRALLCDAPPGRVVKHFWIFLHSVRQLFGASRDRYDAIQVRDMPLLAAVALLASRLRGLPMYYWMSYPMPEGHLVRARQARMTRGIGGFLRPWLRGQIGQFLLYRIVLPRADHVFVTSDRMKLDVVDRGIRPDKVTPLPMGVDLEALEAEHLEPKRDPRLAGRRVLVYLGTLDPVRSIEVLFDMLALVRRRVPEALLLLVGDTRDPAHRDWLHARAEDAGVADHVVWTGWLQMGEAWRYVRSAEVGVSPFPRGVLLDSASPTKVAEYLAVGLPVVCNDNPDQAQLIGRSGAGLCVSYDAQSFAAAVLSLLDEPADRRAERIASGMRMVKAARSYEVLSRQLADVYRNLRDDHRRGPYRKPS